MRILKLRSGSSSKTHRSYSVTPFGANHAGASPNAFALALAASSPVMRRSLFFIKSCSLSLVFGANSKKYWNSLVKCGERQYLE